MKKVALLRSKNVSATEFYYNIIAIAIAKHNLLVYDGFEESELPKEKDLLIVCGSCTSMIKLWLKGYRKIVTWFQGTLPEESYMRNNSWLREKVLSYIEKFALQHSVLNIVVSNAMIEHYERKYGIVLEHTYVMPCYNVEFQEEIFQEKDPNSCAFVYAGGLSKWQCIEQMLLLYKKIEDKANGKAKLLFYTPEITQAKQLIKKYDILNSEVKYVHYSALSEAMKQAKFGFALREDNVVNRVATPTKLANYVANGIIPIYSECIQDFYTQSKSNIYQVSIKNTNNINDLELEKIIKLLNNKIDENDLKNNMKKYFAKYYNTEIHIKKLSKYLGEI